MQVPDIAPGEERKVQKVSLKKNKTKPPAPMTDASLLAAMEHAGRLVEDEALRERMKGCALGTPATRAAIIERLVQVGYVVRRGKTLVTTPKGRELIAVAPEEIASPETTGRWEKALHDIAAQADGERRAALSERFMQGIRRYSAFLVEAAAKGPEAHFERESAGKGGRTARKAAKTSRLGVKCPVCGQGEVTGNSKAFGCSRWKEGCKFTVWRDALKRLGGPVINEALIAKLLSGEAVHAGGAAYGLAGGALKAVRGDSPPGSG